MNGMTLMVKVITRLTLGIIFLLGFYIFIFARTSHGVGLAGGLVIALGLLLFLLAYGREAVMKRVSYFRLAFIKDIFLLIFAAMVFILVFYGNSLPELHNFKFVSTVILVLSNMAFSLFSAGCFFLTFLNLLAFKKEKHLE